MRRTHNRLLATLTAAAALLVSLSPIASANPTAGKTLITMGDSYTAPSPLVAPPNDGCLHSPTSWPSQLAASMGILGTPNFLDTSCSGGTIDTGTGWTLVHQARKAAEQGALGPATRAVLIQIGLNDTWGASPGRAFPSVDCLLNFAQGCGLDAVDQGRVPDYRAVTGQAYANRVRGVVDYVRYYAPNAKVVLVGYPEVFPSGQPTACMAVIAGGQVVQPRAEGYIAYLDRFAVAQREAAGILGVSYFDARAVSGGHGSCAADSWIGGLTDVTSLTVGAPLHPTTRGNEVVAGALRAQFGL